MMCQMMMVVPFLAGSAAMLVPALDATRARPVLMMSQAQQSNGDSVATTKVPRIDPETLEAVKAVVSEVEVLADEDVLAGEDLAPKRFAEQRFDEQHYLTLYNPAQPVQTDSVRVQYQPTLSLYDFLLTERAATETTEEEKSPLDAQVEEKVAGLRLLQAELGVVVSRGLMSEQRQQWLDAKAELEEKKRECTQKWASLQSSHADAADAWMQLAEHAGETPERSGRGRKARRKERKARRNGSSLLASKELGVPTIFAKTPARVVKVPAFAVRDRSPKAQIALIREQVALSEEQKALDVVEAQLMADALQLYQDEQAARERREQILEQQQQILTELQALVEDKGTFGGHAAFVADGFAEGRAY